MPALLAEDHLCAHAHIGAIVNKMVPFQDGWGKEHKKCASVDAPETIDAVSFDQFPFYAEVIRGLSDEQWRVFDLHFVQKIESTSEIARRLGISHTGSVRTHLGRIKAKLARLYANLELIKIRVLPSEEVSDSDEQLALVSRHQLTPPHSVTKDNKPVCRALPPSCRNRKDGMK